MPRADPHTLREFIIYPTFLAGRGTLRPPSLKPSSQRLRNRTRTIRLNFSAREAGWADAELQAARDFQRRAQFYLDFVEAENSTGFHAGQEAVRILGESINFSRQGQVALLRGGQPRRTAAPVSFVRAAHRR